MEGHADLLAIEIAGEIEHMHLEQHGAVVEVGRRPQLATAGQSVPSARASDPSIDAERQAAVGAERILAVG